MQLPDPLAPLPWEPFIIAPLGDVQAGSEGTDWDHLEAHVEKALRAGAWFIGTGDYSDFLSPSNRKALQSSGLYDTAINLIEAWHDEWLERLQRVLKPTAGRWLGLVHGHHFYPYPDGETTDTKLARFLHAPYGGTSSIINVTFQNSNKKRAEAKVYVAHGEGSGFRFLDRVAPGFPDVDLFVMGHNLDSKLGRSGRAQGSYVEQKGMRPLPIGGSFYRLTPREKQDYNDVLIEPWSP